MEGEDKEELEFWVSWLIAHGQGLIIQGATYGKLFWLLLEQKASHCLSKLFGYFYYYYKVFVINIVFWLYLKTSLGICVIKTNTFRLHNKPLLLLLHLFSVKINIENWGYLSLLETSVPYEKFFRCIEIDSHGWIIDHTILSIHLQLHQYQKRQKLYFLKLCWNFISVFEFWKQSVKNLKVEILFWKRKVYKSIRSFLQGAGWFYINISLYYSHWS